MGKTYFIDQIELVRLFPRIVQENEVETLERPVTSAEVLEVLKGFAKDKSPGPDGWTMEFFLFFFDLVGQDLLDVVEESRATGAVNKALNSTFIALIPKVNCPSTLGDFRPISMCNLCYKIISKILAKRIQPILSRALSEEQLGFLKGRQILDAIGTAQECMHNIKLKKLQAIILKLDLKRRMIVLIGISLQLILIQSGFILATTNWILGCVSSVTFSILINGESKNFFQGGRGLRQGCPLSPLLFILVMEGLSLSFKKSLSEGKLTCIKVSRLIKILHLLFVDDIIIMSKASLAEWQEIHRILGVFCRASGLVINTQKSTCLHFGLAEDTLELFKSTFQYRFVSLMEGFKYLGYLLKFDRYKADDWYWLTEKFEK
jgi:hypothetical protein